MVAKFVKTFCGRTKIRRASACRFTSPSIDMIINYIVSNVLCPLNASHDPNIKVVGSDGHLATAVSGVVTLEAVASLSGIGRTRFRGDELFYGRQLLQIKDSEVVHPAWNVVSQSIESTASRSTTAFQNPNHCWFLKHINTRWICFRLFCTS